MPNRFFLEITADKKFQPDTKELVSAICDLVKSKMGDDHKSFKVEVATDFSTKTLAARKREREKESRANMIKFAKEKKELGLSNAAIAREMDISESTVRTLLKK